MSEEMMKQITDLSKTVNDFAWGPVMLILLVGTGIYLSVRLGFPQIAKFGYIMKNTFMTIFKKRDRTAREGTITPFQALTTALAATVGTGNIVGVATAIAAGGPGAVFWMWLSAFFGMMTKYSEILLAIKYRHKNDKGEFVGGPMYYISEGLKQKWLAWLFALLGFLACFGIGNMTQVNSIALAVNKTFGVPTIATGIFVAILAALVIIGGIKRIAATTEKIVPFMAVFYIAASIAILVMNAAAIPAAFGLIFRYAFTPSAAVGGFSGAAVKMAIQKGVARGVFSNEAGLGSAPMAHAAADTDHPVKQAMWGVFEVFVDTIIVCSCTALTILTTGVWTSGLGGSDLTIAAFSHGLSGAAGAIVTIAIFFFAFSTLISWSYYGEKCLEYLVEGTSLTVIFKGLFVAFLVVGSVSQLDLVWEIADTLNGFMAIPNLIGILGLSGVVISVTKEYFARGSEKL